MAMQTKRSIIARCPGCKSEIFFYRTPKLGEFVTCPECADLVEVVSLDPLILDWSEDDGEDEWPDYWDDGDAEEMEGGYYDDDDVGRWKPGIMMISVSGE